MTNYEWLVESGKLDYFMQDICETCTNNDLGDVLDKWHIPDRSYQYSTSIVLWLQKEHKEPKKYVALNDINDILTSEPLVLSTLSGKKIEPSEVRNVISDYISRVVGRFKQLETKEIDDENQN